MKAGEKIAVSAQAVADALKGHVWSCPDENGVMYDVEFTGETYINGTLEIKVKKQSERQPA